jgi:hypothetical protein
VLQFEQEYPRIASLTHHLEFLDELLKLIHSSPKAKLIVPELLENSRRRGAGWEAALRDLALLYRYFSPEVLGCTPQLMAGVVKWCSRSCRRFACETSLPVALQFIASGPSEIFGGQMEQLLHYLPPHELDVLFRNWGNIALPITHRPSRRVRQFVLENAHRYAPLSMYGHPQPAQFNHSQWPE